MRTFWLAAGLVISVFSAQDLSAQAPGEIGQQGILTDSLGNPITSGTFDLSFNLYSEEEGGGSLWSETQSVTVEEGLYSVQLGSVTPISLPFDAQYWLGIEVNGGGELSPRLRFTAAPYARRAGAVDSVGSDAILPAAVQSSHIADGAVGMSAISTDGAETGQLLVANDTSGLAWSFIGGTSIADQSLVSSKISPTGGSTGQILTVEGDTVGWADPEEITGAALPDKSVRAVKLNSEDGAVGETMLVGAADSVVWGQLDTEGIADSAVTAAKISSAGGSNKNVLTIDGGSAGWGQVETGSIANRAVTTSKISAAGGAAGQVLTVAGDSARWKDPAGIEEGSIDYDKISTNGAITGNVLTAAAGDTTGWLPISVGTANLKNKSVTVPKISPAGGEAGQVLSRVGSGVSWAIVEPATFADGSVPLNKLDTTGASGGELLIFDGTKPAWAEDPGLALPYFGETQPEDSTSFQVTSPISFTGQNPVDNAYAIQGVMSSTVGGPRAAAVRGENRATGGFGIGVWGSHAGSGWGVFGEADNGWAIYGSSFDGHAGYFAGKVQIQGTLQKLAGSFTIDHPLDPENKTLSHSFVESPDMMNIYNGNVILTEDGTATVTMPDWFSALNIDFRYQLTPVGGPGPNLHIAEEMTGNSFKIGGGEAGMNVSWQVTGIRDDAYARMNRIQVEEDKPADLRGRYLSPEAFGFGRDRSAAPGQGSSVER
ncbi:MAG: hypothetical protein ACC655_05365 [Rhodothermia bacterium]